MEMDDFFGAQLLALRSKALKADLANLSQMIAVCQIHVAAENTLGNKRNWHNILDVEPEADEAAINVQYKKLSLLLHPDKNKFYGANAAFILICEARRVLLDAVNAKSGDIKQDKAPEDEDDVVAQAKQKFWTICPICYLKYQYYKNILNRLIRCNNCKNIFTAIELKGFTMPYSKENLIIPDMTQGGKTEQPSGEDKAAGKRNVEFADTTEDKVAGKRKVEFADTTEDKVAGKRKVEFADNTDDEEELPKIKMRRGNRTSYL
ncbi:uncharacterized protein LOC124935538 [Impatiens glandulifera]|uniref:uncharacterized protein LOC124935538 n=1 Tax=Impatiens glandulifera TaxID=253017 RepID=UPI001FB12599|nr:uncharacterized protein LOC124935538 [Impatiens glandulifera]